MIQRLVCVCVCVCVCMCVCVCVCVCKHRRAREGNMKEPIAATCVFAKESELEKKGEKKSVLCVCWSGTTL